MTVRPETSPMVGEIETLLEPEVDQLRVVELPTVMEGEAAEKEFTVGAVGVGVGGGVTGAGLTVIVMEAEAEPPGPLAVR